MLNHSGCKNLIEVHDSIGFLVKLKVWNLGYYKKLQSLPSYLMLKSLYHFDLSYCYRLKKFPNIHLEMKCLEKLWLKSSGIRELSSSLGHLTRLISLQITRCPNHRKFLDITDSFDSFSGFGFLNLTSLRKYE
jgi:hypothetical protein